MVYSLSQDNLCIRHISLHDFSTDRCHKFSNFLNHAKGEWFYIGSINIVLGGLASIILDRSNLQLKKLSFLLLKSL